MILPLRAGAIGLSLRYELDGLVQKHRDLNRSLEETWASVLTVLTERWPDWPVEVWSNLTPTAADDGKPTWDLEFRVFFAGEQTNSRDVTAMVEFVVRGLADFLAAPAQVGWDGIRLGWHPLWAIDDGGVYRMLAPERTLDRAVYMLGHYAGQPSYFAAAVEAWPLSQAGLHIGLAEADLGWTFDS